jgi:DNA-binding transcriptional regulator GbsR (MarR family)
MQLSPVQERFILHWGEMGTRWGVNRTVAQVHALLYLWPTPLNAEQITELLGVARSNVSGCIRELQSWGIIETVSMLGDRRDYFRTFADVWEGFRMILDERKKREIDPTLAMLTQCLAELDEQKRPDPHTRDRILAMHEFMDAMSRWYLQLRALPISAVRQFIKAGSKISKFLKVS